MTVGFVDMVDLERMVLGKPFVQLVVKKFAQFQLCPGDDALIKFFLWFSFSVVSHGLLTGLVDKIHRKSTQIVNPLAFSCTH